MELERNDEHFEQILGRLDSLVRRGYSEAQPPPPPSVSEATIPVLTEIFEGVPEAEDAPATENTATPAEPPPELTSEEKMEQAVAAVLPFMSSVLEEVLVERVKPAMETAIEQALVELRPQIEKNLRRHLEAVLTGSETGQTEI